MSMQGREVKTEILRMLAGQSTVKDHERLEEITAFIKVCFVHGDCGQAYQYFLLGYFNIDSDAAPYLLCHRHICTETYLKTESKEKAIIVGEAHGLFGRNLSTLGAYDLLHGLCISNTTAKLPILKLGEYEMWVIRIKQYLQMSVPVTAEEKTNKKNDVKARSLLLMALPNEHQLTFSQYSDAKTMFAAIKTRFSGNEATKKTQKTLLKQQYENFSASSTESPDSIFNRLQKIVSRLTILGVLITQEDLNSKFLRSLPPEWNTHVVVWMNKADIETMSIDDLYNNFKIVKQDVKKSIGTSSGSQNLAFITNPSTSSTNDVNTANHAYEVSTISPNINTACPQDLEQIHEDDLEAMDLKWQLTLLSLRAKRYFQRTGKKIFINANDTARYDKSKVECFNCHKMGYFARECRAPRNKEGQFKYQDSTRKQGNNEDTSSKAMLAIDSVGFDWSDMAEEQVQTNMALMAFSNSEVYNDKTCSKTCLKNYETLKKQCDDLIVKLNQTEFTTTTYKRGLVIIEEQLITYKKNEVLFSEEVKVLKREVACKDYEINVLTSEFEKVKQEKDGIEFKIKKFDNASKSLNKLLESQITGKNPEFKSYGSENSKQESNIVCDKKSDDSKENSDDSLVKEQVSEDTSSFVESSLIVDKETIFLVDKKIEFSKTKNHETPVKKSVRTYPNAQRNMVPRAVLMKTGLKPFNTARTVNTAHPKSIVFSAKPMSHQLSKAVNTARPHSSVVNVVRVNQANAVKASACWVWRPTKLDSASITLKKHNYIDARGRSILLSSVLTGKSPYNLTDTASNVPYETSQDLDHTNFFDEVVYEDPDIPSDEMRGFDSPNNEGGNSSQYGSTTIDQNMNEVEHSFGSNGSATEGEMAATFKDNINNS
ncbi:putative ribonuclease H-like domain-containing protein [Tanacetum coccineum]